MGAGALKSHRTIVNKDFDEADFCNTSSKSDNKFPNSVVLTWRPVYNINISFSISQGKFKNNTLTHV